LIGYCLDIDSGFDYNRHANDYTTFIVVDYFHSVVR